jgi:hypothetical protein
MDVDADGDLIMTRTADFHLNITCTMNELVTAQLELPHKLVKSCLSLSGDLG